MKPFFEHYWEWRLGDIFADLTPVPVDDPRLDYLNRPPQGFLRYACERKRMMFDNVPRDPSCFRNNPTFFITQVHRLWLMIDTIREHIPLTYDSLIVDLGAFPFSLDIALREYLDYQGRILGIVNQELKPEWLPGIAEHRIEIDYANLDPHVAPSMPNLPDHIPAEDNSVDAILFTHVIEHLYHPMPTLKECVRVLKPGGHLLLATDNSYMLGAFLNFLNPQSYLHEPVEGTAAMVFHNWRGHVRFFSEGDLKSLLPAAGLGIISSRHHEVLYEGFLDSFFINPKRTIPGWRVQLLSDFPIYRNEIIQVAEKPASPPPEPPPA